MSEATTSRVSRQAERSPTGEQRGPVRSTESGEA